MAKPDPEALAKALRENLRKRKEQGREVESLPAGGGEGNASGASEGEVSSLSSRTHLSLTATRSVPPRLRQGGDVQKPTTTEARAWALRLGQTGPEQMLWQRLRGSRLNGHKFRRQVALGPFIADFVCHAARLVVEVDDSGHAETEVYDARRTAWLEAEGWRVLRVWNDDVTQRMEGVLEAILAAVEGKEG